MSSLAACNPYHLGGLPHRCAQRQLRSLGLVEGVVGVTDGVIGFASKLAAPGVRRAAIVLLAVASSA